MPDHVVGGSRSPKRAPQQQRRRPSTSVRSAAELRVAVERDEAADAAEQREQDRAELSSGRSLTDRYPERLMPVAGIAPTWPDEPEAQALRKRYEQFCDVREAALLNYGFNSARAYWGDLEAIFWWAEHRRFEVFSLSVAQLNQYASLLRRRKYSENTIRRRRLAHEKLHAFQGGSTNVPLH